MTSPVISEDVDRILSEPLPWGDFSDATFLVTGATGMLGQYVVRTLLALGRRGPRVRIIGLARRPVSAEQLFGPLAPDGRLTMLAQDVASPIILGERADFIIHAASPANPAAFQTDPIGVIRANVAGTDNVLSLAAASGATVCFVSSSEVYGAPVPSICADRLPLTEDAIGSLDPLALRSAYPQSKRMAENLCVAYGAQHGVSYRIARLSYTYGPGMDLSDPRVQAYFFRQALGDEDIVLQSDGAVRRMYTYVSDAVSALFHLLSAPANLTCNVANESAQVSIGDLARLVLRQAGARKASVKFAHSASSVGSSPSGSVLVDCARMRSLGWQARVALDSGVARTLRHHGLAP